MLTHRLATVVPAEGVILERVLDATYAVAGASLSRQAYATRDAAQTRTAWGRGHRRRFALMDGADVLASATQYDLAAILDRRPVRVCGIGSIFCDAAHGSDGHAEELVERLLSDAVHDGAAMALLFSEGRQEALELRDFETISLADVELAVTESSRPGAPMTLIRAGAERDLAAIAAMGRVRASAFRFHLDRDADFIQHAIASKRLLAGLGEAAARELHFFIAEEGITAAAYVVISIVAGTWTMEECGDRDPSGARVGAILQALIAREPAERRPTIRARLPRGFLPPQVTIVSTKAAADVVMIRSLGSSTIQPPLSGDDVLYWPADVF